MYSPEINMDKKQSKLLGMVELLITNYHIHKKDLLVTVEENQHRWNQLNYDDCKFLSKYINTSYTENPIQAIINNNKLEDMRKDVHAHLQKTNKHDNNAKKLIKKTTKANKAKKDQLYILLGELIRSENHKVEIVEAKKNLEEINEYLEKNFELNLNLKLKHPFTCICFEGAGYRWSIYLKSL